MKIKIIYRDGKTISLSIANYEITDGYLTYTDLEGNYHYIYKDMIYEIIIINNDEK